MPNLEWGVIYEYRGLLFEGLIATVQLALICAALSLVLAVLVAIGRLYLPRPIKLICILYTEIFRNIPPLVQLFFWYFASGLSVLESAVIGLSVFNSAYLTEIIRSGVNSIPKTQVEAARSSGLSAYRAIRHVILPQALIRITPMLSNQAIALIKDTSVAMTIGYTELTFQTQMIETQTFRGFEAAVAATALYVALACAVILGVHQIERLLRVDVRRT